MSRREQERVWGSKVRASQTPCNKYLQTLNGSGGWGENCSSERGKHSVGEPLFPMDGRSRASENCDLSRASVLPPAPSVHVSFKLF